MANLKNKRKIEKSRIFKEKLEDVSTDIFTIVSMQKFLKKKWGINTEFMSYIIKKEKSII